MHGHEPGDDLGPAAECAYVVDDTTEVRCGSKVEGTSNHYDHTEGRTVHGHQVIELGIAGNNGLLPLDRQIFTGEKKAVGKPPGKDFRDKRSAAARDMSRAFNENKHNMFRRMLKAAIKLGYKAKYVIADAWYGCKENIAAALECGLEAIFQMKRGNMKYRMDDPNAPGATEEGKHCTALELYNRHKGKMLQKGGRARYKTFRLRAWVNLEIVANKPPQWREVILVLSAPVKESGVNGQSLGERWVVFLCTDLEANAEYVLAVYALRWSIEVYFKEVKQNFGFLREQSGNYQLTLRG